MKRRMEEINADSLHDYRHSAQPDDIFARALAYSAIAMVITDVEGMIIDVNPAFTLMTGYEAGEVAGKHFLLFNAANDTNGSTLARWKKQRAGEVWHDERRKRRKDGSLYWEALSVSPLLYDNEVTHFIVNLEDRTEHWKMHEELMQKNAETEKIAALKDAFFATISHEIRTPLNIILGFSALIEEQCKPLINQEEGEYFDSIRQAAGRLTRTMEHMLSLSSLVSGNYIATPENYDVVRGVDRLIRQFAPLAAEKQIQLEFDHAFEALNVRLDRNAFEQAIQNLIDNAVKFTQQGGVVVRLHNEAEAAVIEVSDTGEGMTAEFLNHVFTPFNQEEWGLTRRYDGLGLGLTLSKSYIEACSGSIDVKSKKGEGTCFTVRLPLRN
ncbi:MAG: PAS domain S-box protein [Bacteroidetes bacterium]|nr:PAS domain S-box protein [Bacteroidota bacterium]